MFASSSEGDGRREQVERIAMQAVLFVSQPRFMTLNSRSIPSEIDIEHADPESSRRRWAKSSSTAVRVPHGCSRGARIFASAATNIMFSMELVRAVWPAKSSALLRAQPPEELGQAVPGFGRSRLHPRLQHPVPVFDRIKERCGQYRRLAIVLLKRDRIHHNMTRHAFELKRVDEPLGRHDLAELTAEGVLVPLRVSLDEPPGAPWSRVQHVDDRRGVALSPPVLNVLRVNMRCEHELTGRVEDARHRELAIRRCCKRRGGTSLLGHGFSPFPFRVPALGLALPLAAGAGIRLADRSSRPRTRDSPPSNGPPLAAAQSPAGTAAIAPFDSEKPVLPAATL